MAEINEEQEQEPVVKKKAVSTKKVVNEEQEQEPVVVEEEVKSIEDAPIGMSIDEFYKRNDLTRVKARVFVKILGKYKFDESTGTSTPTIPSSIRKVSINYWDAVLKDMEGKPFEPQMQLGYEVEVNSKKKMYKFSK